MASIVLRCLVSATCLFIICCGGGESDSVDGITEAASTGGDADGENLDGESLDGVETASEAEEGASVRSTPLQCLTDPDCPRRMVAAHRGYTTASAPENTLASIRGTAVVGADFAEIDVRDTKDGQLVLMHDSDVDRTTDGTGMVSDLTLAEIQALHIKKGDAGDPESLRVPLFSEALVLAKSLGIMLYVDQKTDRSDLVLAAILDGDFLETALVRKDLTAVAPMHELEPRLMVLPQVTTVEELNAAMAAIPGLLIVEFTAPGPDAALCAEVHAKKIKVQQDVLAVGDPPALSGDYTGWKRFIESGVDLLQTGMPQLLVPALLEYEDTGAFPETGTPGLP